MASFNLNDYETVEQRIKRFYGDHSDGRIITENLTTLQDRQVSTWVVKTSIYLNTGDQAAGLPKATGMAFEIDGAGMANKTSALENAETSSIGRALANAGYSGNKRTTREEMAKVERGITPVAPSQDWLKIAEDLQWKEDINGLLNLYNDAVRLKADPSTLERITAIGNQVRQQKEVLLSSIVELQECIDEQMRNGQDNTAESLWENVQEERLLRFSNGDNSGKSGTGTATNPS